MPGMPNRTKAISLVAISTTGDVKTYPTGVYCVPAGVNQQVLASNSTTPTGFGWQYVPDWNETSASLTGIKTIVFVSGTLVEPPQSGAVEFDGTDLFYTTGSTRRNVTARPYIMAYSTSSEAAASSTAENIFAFDTASYSQYIYLSASSRFKVDYPGLYNIQFSIQFTNSDNNVPHQAGCWLKKDGSNVPDSYSELTVDGEHGGGKGQAILSLNLYEVIQSNSYIELAWWADNTAVYTETLPTQSSPTRPKAPSVILTMNKVDYL